MKKTLLSVLAALALSSLTCNNNKNAYETFVSKYDHSLAAKRAAENVIVTKAIQQAIAAEGVPSQLEKELEKKYGVQIYCQNNSLDVHSLKMWLDLVDKNVSKENTTHFNQIVIVPELKKTQEAELIHRAGHYHPETQSIVLFKSTGGMQLGTFLHEFGHLLHFKDDEVYTTVNERQQSIIGKENEFHKYITYKKRIVWKDENEPHNIFSMPYSNTNHEELFANSFEGFYLAYYGARGPLTDIKILQTLDSSKMRQVSSFHYEQGYIGKDMYQFYSQFFKDAVFRRNMAVLWSFMKESREDLRYLNMPQIAGKAESWKQFFFYDPDVVGTPAMDSTNLFASHMFKHLIEDKTSNLVPPYGRNTINLVYEDDKKNLSYADYRKRLYRFIRENPDQATNRFAATLVRVNEEELTFFLANKDAIPLSINFKKGLLHSLPRFPRKENDWITTNSRDYQHAAKLPFDNIRYDLLKNHHERNLLLWGKIAYNTLNDMKNYSLRNKTMPQNPLFLYGALSYFKEKKDAFGEKEFLTYSKKLYTRLMQQDDLEKKALESVKKFTHFYDAAIAYKLLATEYPKHFPLEKLAPLLRAQEQVQDTEKYSGLFSKLSPIIQAQLALDYFEKRK